MIRRIATAASNLWSDTSGVILPYVTLMIFVLVGASLLAIDGARYMSLQTQMQAAADAMALAGAAELDGKPGARARATAAMSALVSNGLSGMGTSTPVATPTSIFLSALPAANLHPSTGTVAADDATAAFVLVNAAPRTVSTLFPVRLFNPSGANSFSSGATAVAGYGSIAICDMPPVFMCNPYTGLGVTLATALSNKAYTRRQLKLINGYGGPGHFGYLKPPDNCNGASCLSDWISQTIPKTCYKGTGVDLNTGNMASVSAAFNVRLDVKQGSLVPDPNHAPDINVRKGNHTDGPNANKLCTYNPGDTATVMRVPDDSAFPSQGGSMGNGQWNCPAYWTANYGGTVPANCRNDTDPTAWTRYDLYNYEIDNGTPPYVDRWSGNRATPPPYNANTGEKGRPVCGPTNGTNGVRDRRLIYLAIINCETAGITPGQTANNIPVAGFGKFFITRPIGNDNTLYGELTGGVSLNDPGASVKVLPGVQLYR